MSRRKILLVEPNYKNKYPPMGLMKISTYHKMRGDDVTFYKGEFKDFILNEIYEEVLKKLFANDDEVNWRRYKKEILKYLSRGNKKSLEILLALSGESLVKENLLYYRRYYLNKDYLKYPKWDRICITSLFTFYFQKTVDTINDFKKICKDINEVKVGGIAASLVPKEFEEKTGIKPHIGLLDQKGIYDSGDDKIIDTLPLDYSILNEVDYEYPEHDGYYAYMTRGCVNKCKFCAVPKLEPEYKEHISIKEQIKYVDSRYGAKRDLLLLDNNVFASNKFDDIIDEIKECGFESGAKFIEPNEYEISYNALIDGINDKGYIKKIVKIYQKLYKKCKGKEREEFFLLLDKYELLNEDTASKKNIIKINDYVNKLFLSKWKPKPKKRHVDFNQGLDARLFNEHKAKKLAEIAIFPLRIAFDSWELKDVYERAVRLAAAAGIKDMSNYLLYNFEDDPIDLYRRIKLNVELCEELNIRIYSFPMKYHPIQDPEYFSNRNYLGPKWNRKFIRSIQAILNATKGKIGRGKSFFEKAFGANEEEFKQILYMPETMIIYRVHYEENGKTGEWKNAYNSLSKEKRNITNSIIEKNKFEDISSLTDDEEILNVLKYYTIKRDDAEEEMN